MNDKNTERDDQATELRNLLNEVQRNDTNDLEVKDNGEQPSATSNYTETSFGSSRDVDILNLPPRKEIHDNKKNRTRVKASRPLVRFSTVIVTDRKSVV